MWWAQGQIFPPFHPGGQQIQLPNLNPAPFYFYCLAYQAPALEKNLDLPAPAKQKIEKTTTNPTENPGEGAQAGLRGAKIGKILGMGWHQPAETRSKKKQEEEIKPKFIANEFDKTPPQSVLRNIQPNIIHQILCFIQKRKRSGQVVARFLRSPQAAQSAGFQIERFYRYQRLIKDKTNNYMNMKGLRELTEFQQPSFQIYSRSQQCNFIRMNCILLKYFLEHEFESVVLTSTRMKAQTRLWHFQMSRKILRQFALMNQPL